MRSFRWLSVALLVFAVVTGAAMLLQREVASVLRSEVDLLDEDNRRIVRLRAEHERLKAAQIPDAELERLRGDHAALVRLRAEIDSLHQRADRMAREEASLAALISPVPPPPAGPPAALVLTLGSAADGSPFLDGAPIDLSVIKQRFERLGRGDRVVIRMRASDGSLVPRDRDLKQAMAQIVAAANEFGLKVSFQTQGAKDVDQLGWSP